MAKVPQNSDQPTVIPLHYGRIRLGIANYITPPMLIALTLMATLITIGFQKISMYFMHGPLLNGIMVVVIVSGITITLRNNIAIYRVAQLLKRVEAVSERGHTSKKEIHLLRVELEGKAHLLSMANFSQALGKLENSSVFTLTDTDARLIKSKFGARVSHMRSKVNYLSGILVMLGLIGTFWGLLGTITSVGQAMTKLADNFAAAGGGGSIDMGAFLQSISKPLEGMGAGFSASLFGLTGSLFLGFLNFLAGHAQNKFIENFSRWIDDCIPNLNQNFLDKVKDTNLPGTDELKAWLAGFVYLSNRTNQQMAQLLNKLTAQQEIAAATLRRNDNLQITLQNIHTALEYGNGNSSRINLALETLGKRMGDVMKGMQKMPASITLVAETVKDGLKAQQKIANSQLEQIHTLYSHIESHSATLAGAADAQTRLLANVTEAGSRNNSTPEVAETQLAELTASISALLTEMNHKNDQALLAIFARDGGTTTPGIQAEDAEIDLSAIVSSKLTGKSQGHAHG
jgi:biopolymer transport protein ExbB/TolQ